jgi:hypothetical protein
MVTKLKDNLSYIKYIREKVKESFPDWNELGEAVYEGQINNNFQINFIGNIQGYIDSVYKISFVNDRGILELRIYDKEERVALGYLLYNLILEKIPSQDTKWRTSLCIELIDFYIYFLRKYFIKSKIENI